MKSRLRRLLVSLAERIDPMNPAQIPPDRDPLMEPDFRDAWMSGWFRPEESELFTGFRVSANDTLLDIGCGDGAFTKAAARLGASIVCADTDAEKIQKLQHELLGITERVQALVTDAAPIPLPDASVTRIVAMEVLEHVSDPVSFAREITRVGAPGAQYLLTVPHVITESLQKAVAPPSYFEAPNHIRIFTEHDLLSLVTSAGLEVVQTHRFGFYQSLWWTFFWATGCGVENPRHPLLLQWTDTWGQLLSLPKGPATKAALDQTLPKTFLVIARKPDERIT